MVAKTPRLEMALLVLINQSVVCATRPPKKSFSWKLAQSESSVHAQIGYITTVLLIASLKELKEFELGQ